MYQVDGTRVIVDRRNVEKIIQQIGDFFISHGLDKTDEPTPLGLEIETLQDKFLSHIN